MFKIFGKMILGSKYCPKYLLLFFGLLSVIGLNTYNYCSEYIEIENIKMGILEEKIFKIFFLKVKGLDDITNIKKTLGKNVKIDKETFVSKWHLFIETMPKKYRAKESELMESLYDLFNIKIDNIYKYESDGKLKIKQFIFDYSDKSITHDERIRKFRNDFLKEGVEEDFFSPLLTEIGSIDAEEYFIKVYKKLLNGKIDDHIEKNINDDINPFLNRVERIVSKNPLNMLINMAPMMKKDMEKNVKYDPGGVSSKEKYLVVNKKNIWLSKRFYEDSGEFYPKWILVYDRQFIRNKKIPLFNDIDAIKVDGIAFNQTLMEQFKGLNSQGNLLIALPKLDFIKNSVNSINNRILSTLTHFIRVDLIITFIFPFIISFSAFIYLKKEIGFLLTHRNMVRKIYRSFFWYPVVAGLLVKFIVCGLLFGYYLNNIQTLVIKIMIVNFILGSTIYYILNWWVFKDIIDAGEIKIKMLLKGK